MNQILSKVGHTIPFPEVENLADPDDANSWTCAACRLPIFSTPFVVHKSEGSNLLLHDQCSDESLPPQLTGHPMHQRGTLILRHRLEEHSSTTPDEEDETGYYCKRCWSICGSKFYECPMGDVRDCGFRLDLPCALSITVLHRSHEHRLTAVNGHAWSKSSHSFVCSACGERHTTPPGKEISGLLSELITGSDQLLVARPFKDAVKAYACTSCDFWIHPDCALLPNAIVDILCHGHPLLLGYSINRLNRSCNICKSEITAFGFYACVACRYYVHIDCAVNSRHHRFEPLLVREAEFPNLLRLPMENEHASAMPRIMKNKIPTYPLFRLGNTNRYDHPISSRISHSTLTPHTDIRELFSPQTIRVHEHPLIYHDDAHNDIVRVCNACTQIILPPDPFYSCANNNNNTCKDFFLHSCCSDFPRTFLSYHSGNCSFRPKVATKPFNVFECVVCKHKCNGSAYYIEEQQNYMDVVCALMPHSITHSAHGKAHILQGRWEIGEFYEYLMSLTCKCCLEKINDDTITSYTCSNCRSFSIHPHCALLPDTVSQKFDRHPLKLITSSSRGEEEEEEKNRLCEICEKDMDWRKWHYGCEECEQYFHANCIPCLDRLSKIKIGFEVWVGCHECPVACVRAVSVDGYLCGHCGKSIRESDDIAFECSKCYFRMHEGCVQELMIKT
ncbi:cysteine/Histidine-rich C1 domain family protein [Striga asiatica]|uniref:Cysteine/Histidine-rich C1 domain family protein n=1 Tax=Striga asiatica TaxID=4170 RepID=A0A5A7Q0X6_STRAF|nr:cysteine/Histidine-rich C1 domain family protein [Striga asiatica]